MCNSLKDYTDSEISCVKASIHMSYSLNPLKWGYVADYMGSSIGPIKGDTRRFYYSSHQGSNLTSQAHQRLSESYMSYNPNLLKGVMQGIM